MRTLLVLLVLTAIGLSAREAEAQRVNVRTPRVDVRAGRGGVRVHVDANRVPNRGPDSWRYKRHNGTWWYWLPSERWVYYSDGRWVDYHGASNGSRTYRGSAGVDGYRTYGDRHDRSYRHGSGYRGYGDGRYDDRYDGRREYRDDNRRYDNGRYDSRRYDSPGGNIGRGIGGEVGGSFGADIGESIGRDLD